MQLYFTPALNKLTELSQRYGHFGPLPVDSYFFAVISVCSLVPGFCNSYILSFCRVRRWCLWHVDGAIQLLCPTLVICTLMVGANMVNWDMVILKII